MEPRSECRPVHAKGANVAREIVHVEFVGLEGAYAPPFAQSVRRIVCEHQSDYYRFLEWRGPREGNVSKPDIAIVAVATGQGWTEVRTSVAQCHTEHIGLLGCDRPILGLPVIHLLRDITELAHGSRYPEANQTVPGQLLPALDTTIPVAFC